MSFFAKNQLLKYGWTEGKGLGKNEDGIAHALKPTLKLDNAGVGYKEFDSNEWWQTTFDNAAKNIKVESHEDQVSLSVADNNQNTEKKERQEYGNFLKSCTLLNGSLVHDGPVKSKEEEDKVTKDTLLFDEQLYKACGSRTAHKTARHGLTLSGKLSRITQQDSTFLAANTSRMSQEDASTARENVSTKKTNAESDMKKNRYKRGKDGNTHKRLVKDVASISNSFLDDMKRHSENVDTLSKKISACNLQRKDLQSRHNSPHYEQLCQQKKENKKEKADVNKGIIKDNKMKHTTMQKKIDNEEQKKEISLHHYREEKQFIKVKEDFGGMIDERLNPRNLETRKYSKGKNKRERNLDRDYCIIQIEPDDPTDPFFAKPKKQRICNSSLEEDRHVMNPG